MKKPLETIKRRAFFSALSGLMLAALFLMAGCEAPSGAPGARPGMGPRPSVPGAPGAGRVPSPKNGGGVAGVKKPSIPGGTGKVAGISGGTNLSAQNPLPAKPLETPDPSKTPEGKTPENNTKTLGGILGGLNPLAPTAKVEQAGNTVNLASEVIVAGTNPFLNRLPKPVAAVDPSATGTGEGTTVSTAPPPTDPFESVSLLGIAYHAKAPMALISVSGGESQTQMVRKGDVLMMDGGQVKVSSISRDSVEFEKLGPGGEKRTFNLPSIIGYGSSSSSDKADDAGAGEGQMQTGTPGGAGKSSMGAPSTSDSRGTRGRGGADLANLNRISAGRPSGQPSGEKSADVVLKEP